MHIKKCFKPEDITDVEYLLSLVQCASELAFELEKLMLDNANTHLATQLAGIIPISITIKNKLSVIWDEYIMDYSKENLTIFSGEEK